ncbi:MAG: hypothetical protein JKY65_12875 [Planctomycetes bacterium]|nr:hypothetical protein [Planctomycetota bacterium]
MNRIPMVFLTLSLTFAGVACKSKEEPKTEAKTEEAKTEEAKTEEVKTEEKKTGPQPTRVD